MASSVKNEANVLDSGLCDSRSSLDAMAPGPGAAGPLSDRQAAILSRVEHQGFVTIESLAERFGVSAQTVRRDIIALDRAGLIQRFHGGAGTAKAPVSVRLGHERKRELNADAKRLIAHRVTAQVPDGAAVFLDVGTTLEAAALALNDKTGLLVITNSLRAALNLSHDRHEVHVLGGRLSGKDGSVTGEAPLSMLAGLRLDMALIGCSAIEDGGRVMDFDLAKIAVKRAAMRVARASVLLAAQHKFGRTARAEIAPLDAFAAVITEADARGTPAADEQALSAPAISPPTPHPG